MIKHRSFAVIGGDLRQVRLADMLADEGYSVKVYGFNNNVDFQNALVSNSLAEAMEDADIVVLPLPMTFDGDHINTPLFDGKIDVNSLLQALGKNQLLLAGMIDQKTMKLIEIYNVYAIDYFQREELTVLNAVPTAEGAIEITMRELPTTLHGSRCLILGFGRVSKVLAKMLAGIGAEVTVAARRHDALAWADVYGYKGAQTDDLSLYISEFDVIFNTVPSKILTRDILENVHKDALILDLASKPGGVDFILDKEILPGSLVYVGISVLLLNIYRKGFGRSIVERCSCS